MSRSYKHSPVYKDKQQFFRKYMNRRERRRVRRLVESKNYDLAQVYTMPRSDYDITDWKYECWEKDDLPESPREKYKFLGK